jgi:PAS domain S-box-containing protein
VDIGGWDEAGRLEALGALRLLDTPQEERFDRITRVVQAALDVPIALVSLVDADRQWFKSCQGLSVRQTPRSVSFCAHAIADEAIFEVPDARLDERFADSPLVTGAPHIRFYAGKPIHAPNGARIGTLCAIDRRPRSLDRRGRGALEDLAKWVELEIGVTQMSRAANELDRIRHHLASIVNAAGEAICAIDANGTIVLANATADRLLGWTGTGLVGEHFPSAVYGDGSDATRPPGPLGEVLAEGRSAVSRDDVFRRRDGTSLRVAYSASPLADHAGVVGCVLVFQDVTQRRALERQKDEALAFVGHELRTPLTAVRGSLSLLADGSLGTFTGKAGQIVDMALRNTERLSRLLEGSLELERLAEGADPLLAQDCELLDIVSAAVYCVDALAAETGVDVRVDVPSVTVRVDHDRLVQVLVNLLGNAMKFSPRGGVVVVGGRTGPEYFELTVSDDGRGIPPELQESIFERFVQVEAADKWEKGGTGLGLPIARGIVEAHGGRIEVMSRPGQGSTFTVTVPHRLPGASAD